MNRLQKKCVIATAGFHLLLLTILIVGPAFFNPQPKPDTTKPVEVIPANLVDIALNSGIRTATPPPPAPIITPPPQPTPPTPTIQPPPPVPKPVVPPPPTLTERIEKLFTPEPKPVPVKPMPEKPAPKPHQIQVNTQLVVRTQPKPSTTPDNSQKTSQAVSVAIRNLQKNLKPGTAIDMPGDSTVSYANYDSAVKSFYDRAWTLPDSIANDDENVRVTVTIARDGTVVSSHIIEKAGDAPVDKSVQRTLDRVTFIAPFPAGSTDQERTYTINFNPKAKRSIE